MLAVASKPSAAGSSPSRPLPLESGEFMHSREFLRRYERMPQVKKAELIEGVASSVGTGLNVAGWTGGLFNEWSEITLILGTLNIGFPGFSEVMNSSAPSRSAAQRFRASAAAIPWAEAKARASFPSASLNGSSCLTWAK